MKKLKKLYTETKYDKKDNVVKYLHKILHVKPEGSFTHKAVETFYDKECRRSQCIKGKSRSIYDVYRMCLVRFPNLTKRSFEKSLYKFLVTSRKGMLFCPDVNKWVICSGGDYFNGIISSYGLSQVKIKKGGAKPEYNAYNILKHGFSDKQIDEKIIEGHNSRKRHNPSLPDLSHYGVILRD